MRWVTKAVIIPIVTFAVVILVTVFGILPFLTRIRDEERANLQPALPTPSKTSKIKTSSVPGTVCRSNECAVVAGEIAKALDERVDPCDNFYGFACGNWMTSHQSPLGEWSQASELTSVVSRKLLDIVANSPVDISDPVPIQKAKQFLKACVLDDLNDGELHLKNISEKYTKQIGAETPRLDSVIAEINRDLGANCIFLIAVNPDEVNKSGRSHVVYIDNPFNVPGKVKLNGEEYATYKTAYTKFIQDSWHLIFPNISSEDAKRIGKEIVSFEKQLEEISYVPDDDLPHNTEYYHLLTLPELNRLTANTHIINWERYFAVLFKDFSPPPTANLETFKVVVKDLQYIKQIGNMLRKTLRTSPNVIGHYLKWRIILCNGYYASQKYQDMLHAFIKVYEKSSPLHHMLLSITESSRETKCWLLANTRFEMAIAYLYVKHSVPHDLLDKVREMVILIRQKFYDLLNGSKWILAEATKSRILDKVKRMNALVGFPDVFNNLHQSNSTSQADFDAVLNEYYKYLNVNMNDNHFDNYLQLTKWGIKENLAMVNNPKNPKRWLASPTHINAFYFSEVNSIVIPVAKLQPPFYFPDIPVQAINYGSIGSTIGHEYTHGLDHIERELDEEGRLNYVWDSDTFQSYEERKKCFALQYGDYSVHEIQDIYGELFRINGTRTLDENFADNGGLTLSFKTYKEYVVKSKTEVYLPGLKYSPQQIFFIAFAQSHCGSYSLPVNNKDSLYFQLKTSKYSPYRFRVMGAIANSPDFSSVWNCRQPSNENICSVW